jgi:tetratricopeptide (TPR) repeat protein
LVWFVLGVVACGGSIRADDAKKPDAAPPKVEEKAGEPKKEEAKKDEPKKDEVKKDVKPKESVEKRMARRKRAIDEAVLKEDWDAVLAGLDEIIDDKEINADDHLIALYNKFTVLAEEKLDGAKACPVAKELAELLKDDPEDVNDIAWTILVTEGLKNRDLDVALALAKKANDMAHGQDGAILDTLARAHFEKGDLDKAVDLQTKAIEKIGDNYEVTDEVKEEMKGTLEKYKAKQTEKKSEKKEEKKGVE